LQINLTEKNILKNSYFFFTMYMENTVFNSESTKMAEPNVSGEALRKREALKKLLLVIAAGAAITTVGVGAYFLIKRYTGAKVASKVFAAASIDNLVKKRPEFLKVPEFLTAKIQNVGISMDETLSFLKVVQYDPSFSDRRNIGEATNLLSNIYDRLENLIILQNSPEFDERKMRSMERVVFMLCKKSLKHQQICKNLETKQLINGLMLALDRHSPNK
jgi:hypothetical protein